MLKTTLPRWGRPGSTQEFRGLPAGSRVQSRPQAHRGDPTSLHLPRILAGQTSARRTGCGLPAPSLLVRARGHKKLLETWGPEDPRPWHSASSSLPSLLLTRCPNSPGRPQARRACLQHRTHRGLLQEASAGLHLHPVLLSSHPFVEHLSPEDAPSGTVFNDTKEGLKCPPP